MSLLDTFVHIGTGKLSTNHEKRGIIVANYLTLILAIVYIIIFLIRLFSLENQPVLITVYMLLLGLALLTLPIALNALNYTIVSRAFLCVASIIFLWILFWSQIKDLDEVPIHIFNGLRIYMLGLSVIPFLVFGKSNYLILLVMIFCAMIPLAFYKSLWTALGMTEAQLNLLGEDYDLMQLRIFAAYIILNCICFIFHQIIIQNDKSQAAILNSLEEKSEHIKDQNFELVDNQRKLKDVNIHLENLVERKRENIERQNEKLINLTKLNAYHLREPIDRLLEIIEESNKNSNEGLSYFFKKVELETKVIDNIINEITKELNDID